MRTRRIRFVVQGQVQGVGFRPFVFRLAQEAGLTGFVRNSPRGVVIEAQGDGIALELFAQGLESRLPPQARITGLEREECKPEQDENVFSIVKSSRGDTHAVLIGPDTATCPDCLQDMANPHERRFRYAFTNCTNCGPRYTITRSIPYDRPTTSMACFSLCPHCRDEYEDPHSRRFHAQPNACPICGPHVWFVPGAEDAKNFALPSGSAKHDWKDHAGCLFGDAALQALATFLHNGGIAAIKGLGGFHLACDACDETAVGLLRQRKNRPHKPFALMAANLEETRLFARIGREEEALLVSIERPIVICPLSDAHSLAPAVSPDTCTVGIMLPYTPLHHVLLTHFSRLRAQKASSSESKALPAALVMTSGNPGGEPICLGNREALANLAHMADAFLLHNRDILIRVDDSVLRPLPSQGTLIYRRARGYVPRPLSLLPTGPAKAGEKNRGTPLCVFAAGADLKNTPCLTKGADAFVGQHIGDMANLETAAFHSEICDHLEKLLKVHPVCAVADLHPDSLSARMAEEMAQKRGIPLLRLQHHFAHAYAVLAENGFQGKALALTLDGTGFGEDGRLWGGEFLLLDTTHRPPLHKRLAHFAPLDLPGGDTAIREPWRLAHALLLRLGLIPAKKDAFPSLPWLPECASAAALLPAMLARRVNIPQSTSCGRLFDAVSALLGLCTFVTYEGQAAIRLEEASNACNDLTEKNPVLYPCPFFVPRADADHNTDLPPLPYLDSHALFAALFADRQAGTPVPLLARRFHRSLAAGILGLTAHLAKEHSLCHIGLSGGCLQNLTLAKCLARELKKQGLVPLMHRELPPGDGCISFGQAAWAVLSQQAVSQSC